MYASPSDNTLWTPVTYYRIALHLNEKAKSKTHCLPTFLTRKAKEKHISPLMLNGKKNFKSMQYFTVDNSLN